MRSAELGNSSTTISDGGSIFDLFRRAVRVGEESVALATALARGITDENQLTNFVFFARHPELGGRPLEGHERDLIQEWLAIRDREVRPVLRGVSPGVRVPLAPATLRRTSWLRQVWQGYRCAESRMVWMRIFGRNTPVNPLTTEAFGRLERALESTGFRARSAWNYNCRDIKGRPGQTSLHAYGLAIDLDPDCNPHRTGAPHPARFSGGPTPEERCRDVRARLADTTFTPAQIGAVEAIRTLDGLQVFAWGGRWRSSPDAMHFQINVSPAELGRGLASGP